MMDDSDNYFIGVFSKRSYATQEISDLLKKRNPNVRDFSFRLVQDFCRKVFAKRHC